MNTEVHFELVARDKQGKPLHRVQRPSESFVRAFIDALASQFAWDPMASVPDTLGTNRTLGTGTPLRSLALDDNSLYGPVLGTGTNAVALGDYALQTQIAHGLGAGQLDHQVTEFQNLQTIGTTRQFELRRLFVNQSGGVITVNECGIYFNYSTWYFCAVRDLVSPGVAVPDLGTATLIYTIGVTV